MESLLHEIQDTGVKGAVFSSSITFTHTLFTQHNYTIKDHNAPKTLNECSFTAHALCKYTLMLMFISLKSFYFQFHYTYMESCWFRVVVSGYSCFSNQMTSQAISNLSHVVCFRIILFFKKCVCMCGEDQ